MLEAEVPTPLQPMIHMAFEREQREERAKSKNKVLVALFGEGVKTTEAEPTRDKHSTKKLQGKFKHWGPRSRKLVTWVTS